MAAGRKPITQNLYDSLLAAFRDQPGNVTEAARRALCDRRTAKRCYFGPPYKDYPFARPIRLVLDQERLEAQARAREQERARADAAEADREKLRQAAIEARTQEETILKVARGDVLSALGLAAEIVPAMRALAAHVRATLVIDPTTGKLAEKVSPKEALQMMTRHATLMQKAVGAAHQVLELSRIERGEPNQIVQHQLGAPPSLSYEEALVELEEAEALLKVARLKGLPLPAMAHPSRRDELAAQDADYEDVDGAT